MKDLVSTVKSNVKIAENIYAITLTLPENVGEMHGGQFVNLATGDNSLLLRRPLGVCKVDGRDVTVCYQVKGVGTDTLKKVKPGETLRVLLPLGNWFDVDGCKNVIAIGGGVGIFPLICTIRENYKDINFYSYMGFRNKNAVCLMDDLEKSKTLTVTTDDGSYGRKGNAVSAFIEDADKIKADAIIACGPPVMLRVLKAELEKHSVKAPCYVSLEERMGCGMGACLVCVCKLENGENARVCRDGPVFDIGEVKL